MQGYECKRMPRIDYMAQLIEIIPNCIYNFSMNILFIEWKSYGNEDIKDAFKTLHHMVYCYPFDGNGELHQDDKIENEIKKECNDHKIDAVFSFNYYPVIARTCSDIGIIYLSWIYDNPYVLLYSHTIILPTNHIFVFDRSQYMEFHNNNINTVHYLPLAANAKRLQGLINDTSKRNVFKKSKWYNQTPIAFVGSLYTEKHQFYKRMKDISDKTRGYLEAIMEAQKHIYGYNFIQDVMTEDIMADMSKNLPLRPDPDGVETREYLFSEYVINRQLTAIEREEYLKYIADNIQGHGDKVLDLYTPNEKYKIDSIINHGSVDYYNVAPYVYNTAKININITLRSIHSGIPLRAFEIMGAGGFLLSNYQADFADCYTEGEDYIAFDSKEDMLNKIEYYLSHDKERKEIAEHGLKTTLDNHTYEQRITSMLEYLR